MRKSVKVERAADGGVEACAARVPGGSVGAAADGMWAARVGVAVADVGAARADTEAACGWAVRVGVGAETVRLRTVSVTGGSDTCGNDSDAACGGLGPSDKRSPWRCARALPC